MTLKFHCQQPLKVLSDDHIATLHNDTLQVLEEVGVKFEDPVALDLLSQHGWITRAGRPPVVRIC